LVKGVVGAGRRLRCDQANGENAARSRAPLKNGAAVGRSRLKIATDVAVMLGSSETPAKTGRSFSLAKMEIDGAQRGDPGPAESAMGPMEKMLHRGDIQVRPSHRGTPGWILRRQESAEPFQALVAVAVDLSSSSGVEDASSGRHATPVGRDLDVTSLRPGG
jgi:hypothetical protein